MALSKKVFLRNCTHLSEARYAAGMEVEYIGFTFTSSDSDNHRANIKAIFDWLSGVQFVAELTEPNVEMIEEIQTVYQPAVWLISPEVLPLMHPDAKVVLSTPSEDITDQVIGQLCYPTLALEPPLSRWVIYHGETDLLDDDILVLEGQPEERPGFANLDDLAEVLESLEVSDL
jgi:phosphoribosylanthranilate isomerase